VILSNQDIKKEINSKSIIISPPPPFENFSTSSLDLTLDNQFWKWRDEANGVQLKIDCSKATIPSLKDYAEEVKPNSNGCVSIPNHGFLLGRTLEVIHLPATGKIAGRVEGRSSLARLGLGVHITAPIIHNGFNGPIVLEFMNHGPHELVLRPGITRICQIVFEYLASEPTVELDTVFQNQVGAFGRPR
jgi:dCTP deaminase